MSLLSLNISNLRILAEASIEPSLGLNLIYGENASGKTSILEGIHLLATARSFRSANLADIRRYGEQNVRVTAKVTSAAGDSAFIGIEKSADVLNMRAAGEKLTRVSALAAWLPVQIIHPDSHQLVSGGPKLRRQFLDWGVFHVEHAFIQVWRRYDQALKQRNAALKAQSPNKAVMAWDKTLNEAADAIHTLRLKYVEALLEVFPGFTQAISGEHGFQLGYQAGWDTSQPLSTLLLENLAKDRQRGFTSVGPHRADLVFRMDERRAKPQVSRGQQKMLVMALSLAQAELFSQQTGRSCVILLDDLAAELDNVHRGKLLAILQKMALQVFITAVSKEALDISTWQDAKVFHVEHGQVKEVV